MSVLQSNPAALINADTKKACNFAIHCKHVLENDPAYASQINKIFLWEDWPNKSEEYTGIDLIAETHTGEIWAIQAIDCKQSDSLTKKEIETFLKTSAQEDFSYRLILCTTNHIEYEAREAIASEEKQVGVYVVEHMYDAFSSIDDEKLVYVRKTPRPHQEEALSDLMEGFQKKSKGQLYMACGTGKTLVSLWLAERLNAKQTLVLVPSISLIAQFYQEWVTNAKNKFLPIFVCSDTTVSHQNETALKIHDLGFPATTDPKKILSCLSFKIDMPKVVFSTYHSSPVIKEVCLRRKSLQFDLSIADEAHRCAGSVDRSFSTLLEEKAIRTHKTLFMTATSKIFSSGLRNENEDVEERFLSMDDTKKFGSVFHTLPFSKAIEKDLLSDYEVLISILDDKSYRDYIEKEKLVQVDQHTCNAKTLVAQMLLAKAIRKYGLRRVITFHSRKKTAREFVETLPAAINLLPQKERPYIVFCKTILGDMLQSERKQVMEEFTQVPSGEAAILSNVRCLSEGVDIPAIDGATFIDPKGSEIEIVQAVGRAIRKSPNKQKGFIILPIFLESQDCSEECLEHSCFEPIWKVLKALRAHDDALGREIDMLRMGLAKDKKKENISLNKITINTPMRIDRNFVKSLRIAIVNSTSASWFYYFGLLQAFKEKHGHTNVPLRYTKNKKFGSWVIKERVNYKKGLISQDRIDRLNKIGFVWDVLNDAWEEKFAELASFKEKYGHTNVPLRYTENNKLGNWVIKERINYKKKIISQDRIDKLNSLNFSWDPLNDIWEERFNELIAFKEEHGHTNVPRNDENKELGTWVNRQRFAFKTNKIGCERIDRLNKIGFSWDPLNDIWEERFNELIAFKEKYGHTNVPSDDENKELGTWVQNIRKDFNEKILSKKRINRLNSLGFVWRFKESLWEERFTELISFKDKYGHTNVPSNDENKELGGWIGTQRLNYKKGLISQDRIDRLNKIGFVWDRSSDALWEEKFQELCDFKKENGHTKVYLYHPENKELISWIHRQRFAFKQGGLEKNRIDRLNKIGFVWDVLNDTWEERFQELCVFSKRQNRASFL